MKTPVFIFLSILFASNFFYSCASQKNKSLETFDYQMRLYGRLLRWQEYDGAINILRHQDESVVEASTDDLQGLRVVDYQIKSIIVSDDRKSAVVNAEISYFFENQNIIKKLRDTQNWWYLEEAEKWYLDGGLPNF